MKGQQTDRCRHILSVQTRTKTPITYTVCTEVEQSTEREMKSANWYLITAQCNEQ